MPIRYKTSSPAGDLLSILPGIKQMFKDTKAKAVIYQRLDMVGASYIGAQHQFGNQFGEPICFNQYMFDMMRPLLMAQDYIEDFIVYEGQEFDIDLDEIRQKIFTNQPLGQINRWVFHAFPQMSTDLSKEWIEVAQITLFEQPPIVINFTLRHRNPIVNYFFLKNHQDKIIFAGLKEERDYFCDQFKLDIPLLEVKDFLELGGIIKGSKFFMGNASMCFQLAEGMKVPRILELFPNAPNVIPIGENSYDFYHQSEVEYYFEKLLKNVHP